MVDEDRSSGSTLGALHRGVEASVDGQRNLLVPNVDVVARVLGESLDNDLGNASLVPCRLGNVVLDELGRNNSVRRTGVGFEGQVVDSKHVLLGILEVPVLTELVLLGILIGSNVAVEGYLHRGLGDVGHLDNEGHPVASTGLEGYVVGPLTEVTHAVPQRVLRIVLPVGVGGVEHIVDTRLAIPQLIACRIERVEGTDGKTIDGLIVQILDDEVIAVLVGNDDMANERLAFLVIERLVPAILTFSDIGHGGGPHDFITYSVVDYIPIQVGGVVVGNDGIVGVVRTLVRTVVVTEHGAEQATIGTFGHAVVVIVLTRVEGQCRQKGQ